MAREEFAMLVRAEQKKQIQALAKRQMKLMRETTTQKDRDYQMMLWCGFLTGLKLTNAITAKNTTAILQNCRSWQRRWMKWRQKGKQDNRKEGYHGKEKKLQTYNG